MSTAGRKNHPLPRIFKGCWERTGRCKTCSALPSTEPYLRAIPFQGVGLSRRKENSSQSPHQRLRVCLHYHLGRRPQGSPALSAFKFGNINPIPFREVAPSQQTNSAHLLGTHSLGPTHPCPTAVHIEPFSTTTTQARTLGCNTTAAPSYTSGQPARPDGRV